MTSKDYIAIAAILNDSSLHLQDSKKIALASRFADLFETDNHRFDRKRFYAAVGIDKV